LGLISFVKASVRLLKFAKKPSRDELWLSIKICFLGVLIIGLVGFVIYMLAGFIRASIPIPRAGA
jgi:protein transport protein SEC61 subunit gamma-like protein